MNVSRPTALIDLQRCRSNIQNMAGKLDQLGITYRPHFKTHQSAEIGSWFREYGVTKITVSSVEMAAYFHHNGWNDITIAFPVTSAQFDKIDDLAANTGLTLFINDPLTAQYFADNISQPLQVIIEIDPGFGRSGLSYSQFEIIESIHDIIRESEKMNFYGFYIHDGSTYNCTGKSEVQSAIRPAMEVLDALKSDFPDARICLGDTPSASLLTDFPGIDELSPGNNVFYDLMQLNIGSCTEDKPAFAVGCTVAQVKEARNEAVIYGGAVHFSKDRIIQDQQEIYGIEIEVSKNGFGKIHRNRQLIRLSQEHGIIKGDPEWIRNLNPGNTIFLIPAHSCLTANLYDHYLTTGGKRIEKRILS